MRPKIGPARTISLGPETWAQVDELRSTLGKSSSAMVRQLVEEALFDRRRALVLTSDEMAEREAAVDTFGRADAANIGDARWEPYQGPDDNCVVWLDAVVDDRWVDDRIGTVEIPDSALERVMRDMHPHGATAEQLAEAGAVIIGHRCQKDQHERCHFAGCGCDCHGGTSGYREGDAS